VTKLEYPLTLHQNLAKTSDKPFIPNFPAIHAFGCLQARSLVTRAMQRRSALSNSSTIYCLATPSLRRGAGACPHFGSRILSRGCARCSATDTAAVGHASQEASLVCTCRTGLVRDASMTGSACSPNFDKLNRQIQEVEHLLTHRKQTTAPHSNRQFFHFCPTAFPASFQPDAACLVTPRNPSA
jgi:hypothetical protein